MFAEIAKRMGVKSSDVTYLGEKEIIEVLSGNIKINPQIIKTRKKGFVLYLNQSNKLVCLQGNIVSSILSRFHLVQQNVKLQTIQGMIAYPV